MSPQEIYQQAVAAGFSPQQAVTMTAIALAESGGNPGAVSKPNRNGTIDRGLWQINSVHSQYDTNRLVSDPTYNANAAFQIAGGGGNFKPWSTFNNGAYRKFLPAAQAAATGDPSAAQQDHSAAGVAGSTPSTTAHSGDLGSRLQQATQIIGGSGYQNTPVQNTPAGAMVSKGNSGVTAPHGLSSMTTETSAAPEAVPQAPDLGGAVGTAIKTALAAATNKTPYVWGGNSLDGGVDCSGLIQEAYKAAGINLPRVSNDQINAGTKVDPAQMQPGDLLGWAYNQSLGGGATHVAMYIGGGKMVEALHKGEPVHVVDVRHPQFVTRVSGGATAPAAPTAQPQADPNDPNSSLDARIAAVMNAFSASFQQQVA